MYKVVKRFIDVVIALVALILLSPLLLITILVLVFTGEHEVIYKQKRIGYKTQPFYIWKFATMLRDSPNIGTGEVTVRNDPRVTTVGRFLRMSKINELPQIVNVLKGDMSIVGPRPLMEVSYLLYPAHLRARVYDNKPGITGIGSVVFRDEEKMVSAAEDPRSVYESIFPYKAELEIWYLTHKSLYTDFKIIFLTGWLILFPQSRLQEKMFPDLPKADFNTLSPR